MKGKKVIRNPKKTPTFAKPPPPAHANDDSSQGPYGPGPPTQVPQPYQAFLNKKLPLYGFQGFHSQT